MKDFEVGENPRLPKENEIARQILDDPEVFQKYYLFTKLNYEGKYGITWTPADSAVIRSLLRQVAKEWLLVENMSYSGWAPHIEVMARFQDYAFGKGMYLYEESLKGKDRNWRKNVNEWQRIVYERRRSFDDFLEENFCDKIE